MQPSLQVQPAFAFDKKKTRRSASGIACGTAAQPAGPRPCLVVFDEGTQAQFAWVQAQRLQPFGDLITLVDGGGELDAEAAALGRDGFFYVSGSHSVKRQSCAPNPASRQVLRFKATPATGAVARMQVTARQGTGRLWDLLLADPVLGPHAEGCLGEGSGGTPAQLHQRPGLNIEGLAALGGRLYFGLRAPVLDGAAALFSVDAQALFGAADAQPRLDRLALGAHVGIRDMVAVKDALLLLVGPDDFDAGSKAAWRVAWWQPGGQAPRVLATLDARQQDIGDACFEALKPEALAVLEDSPARLRVLVLSDGVCDGGPLVFDLPR